MVGGRQRLPIPCAELRVVVLTPRLNGSHFGELRRVDDRSDGRGYATQKRDQKDHRRIDDGALARSRPPCSSLCHRTPPLPATREITPFVFPVQLRLSTGENLPTFDVWSSAPIEEPGRRA